MTTLALAEFTHTWLPPQVSAGFVDSEPEPVCIARPIISPQSTASSPKWLSPILRRMTELSRLGRNWDNRGSAAIHRDTLAFTFQMLWQVMAPTTAPPSIVPLGHGGVQLLWSNSAAELEVEVTRPQQIVIYHLDRTAGTEREWPTEIEFTALAELLRANFTAG